MNLVLRIGQWLEKRFPEKLSAESVLSDLRTITSNFNGILDRLEILESQSDMPVLQDHLERIKKLEEQVKTIQTQGIFKSRVIGSIPDTMTPFATRLSSVQPATKTSNEVNRSLQ